MAGNALGTAYVQVVPKLEKGSLDGMGQQLGGMLGKLAALAALASLAKGLHDLGKAALDSYADFEQLVGGVETLYKDSADVLIANAQRAYMTAGLSANEYMETSTSFAAALVSSLGGDTAEAARLADVAITDMADNANKMGTDMEAIQNAYQGFAKQNYTMLDNLKLGYGGTKTEMERLLADAEAISGIHYDIESYSDVVSAIHVIQDEMGIAGTTAEEAATTISGSWGMLQGSWANLLTSIAGGGDEIDVAVKAVFDSLATWLGNVAPRILEIARGIFTAIPEMASEVMSELPGLATGFIRDAFGSDAADAAMDFVNTLHGILGSLGELFAPLGEFASGNGPAFADMMSRIEGHMGDLHTVVAAELLPAIRNVIAAAQPIIDAVLPVIIDLVGNLGSAVVGVLPVIAEAIASAMDIVSGILTTVTTVWDGIKSATTTAFDAVRGTISSVWNGIKSTIEGAINGARDAVGSAIDAIKGFFSFEFRWPHIPLPHFSITGSVNPIDWLTSGLPQIGIEWYGHGGFFDKPTVMLPGVSERGAELVWPSYEPELSKYATAIASRMDRSGGRTYIFNAREINSDRMLRQAVDQAALTAARRAGML